jgi:NAD(P)-dependent dehydrogenase (short-subunit alcohol dehydrogenase family)
MTQLESNLISTCLCSRAAIAAFRRSGNGGRIVNIAARQALESRLGANLTAYTVAKAGVVAFTIALAEEVAKEGILVNAVAPSIMDTPANRASMPKADFNAWPKVEEVAASILFLASAQNQVTRGAIVPTYGKA